MEASFDHIFHYHLNRFAAHVGLQVKKLKTKDLRERLNACWECWITAGTKKD